MYCIHCGETLGNNDIAMEHAGKCPVMTGDFSPPDTERDRMSIIELENPTRLTELDCDAKIKDTLETVISISKAEEIMHEFKRAIEETQDHAYLYSLLILGDHFSIRFIVEPDIKTPEKIHVIDQKTAVLPDQDDTPIFEVN
jgi:hypothetical protein